MRKSGRFGAALLALCLVLCGCTAGAQREASAAAANVIGGAVQPASTPAPVRQAEVGAVPKTTPEPSPTPTPPPAPEALLLQGMTTEEKVGQMFFVRCPETDGAAMVARYQPGGILLFGRDFDGLSREQVTGAIESYQNEAKIKLLVGADEEGGDVVRISDNPQLAQEPYWSIRNLYAAGGTELLCVLVMHNIVPCVDGEAPASLSAAWHAVLRDTLGFSGVIITDDLSMGGVTDYTDGESAAVAAVLAGNDMLCCTDFETQIPAVVRAVEDGTISEARIDESVLRILRWKLERGLISAPAE